MPKLYRRTKRFVIRPLSAKDYQEWRNALSTRGPQKNLWDHGPKTSTELTRSKFRRVLKLQADRRRDGRFFDFGIFLRSGELVGHLNVMSVMRGNMQSAFLGYAIYNPYWGKGYGKETVRALIDMSFRDLKLHRVEVGIEPNNRRSIFLARALKLRKEGLKKRVIYLRRKWVDLVVYSVTCEELGFKWRVPKA